MRNNTLFNNPWERSVVTYPYVWWDAGYSDEELARIQAYCEDKGFDRAKVLGTDPSKTEEIEKVRRCDVKFHSRNDDTAWFFDKMNNYVTLLNNQFYGFDLNGYDSFQYTSYRSEERGTYDWHVDMCLGRDHLPASMVEPRKLSVTLLVNDPSEFDGGEFLINDGADRVVPFVKGRIVAFPSFMLHKVTPLTRGTRKSIVVWVVGPKFR